MKNWSSAIILIAAASWAQTNVSSLLEQKVLDRITKLDQHLDGVLGAAAIDLRSGHTVVYHGDAVFPQASSIKIPILMEIFRQAKAGKLQLDQKVTLRPEESVGGSGHLQILLRSQTLTVSVRELATAMIQTSDNTATNKLIGIVGMDSVNELIASYGLKQTRLQRRMLEPGAAAADRENISTPIEMARLMEAVYKAGDASKEMIDILKLVDADFRKAIPGNVTVASKPGELNGVRAETGIIFLEKRPFVLSVMSTYLAPQENPVPAVARIFFDYFEKLGNSNRYGHNLQ